MEINNEKNNDELINETEIGNGWLKVSVGRTRKVTYWGNNSSFDREEISAFSSLLIKTPESGFEVKNEALLAYLSNTLKKAIDEQEKSLPKPRGEQ